MEIRIRYFAAFREAAGVESEAVETTADTIAALFKECQARHSALEKFPASLAAVNDEMADWEAAISAGDEVLFFPPVAGG